MRPSTFGATRPRMRASGWLLLTVACGIGLLATAHAQATIPAALTDRQFWDLIGSLSEPDGAFEDENYVSNELGYQRTMERLQKTVAPGGVFIGVGPEQNFHYVAALRPSITDPLHRRGALRADVLRLDDARVQGVRADDEDSCHQPRASGAGCLSSRYAYDAV